MQDFLNQKFLNNTVLTYAIFIGSLILSFIAVTIIYRFLRRRLKKWVKKTETTFDDLVVHGIIRYIQPILYFGVFYLNTKILTISPTLSNIINVITITFMTFWGAVLISTFLIFLFNKYWEKKNRDINPMATKWIAVIIKSLVWIAAVLLFLENIGVEITALVAGLGVGGVAIAFAAQAILEDIFSFVTIFFDKPFEIGDFLVIGDFMGTVEHIGIKTTRIRSLLGEQLVFSNKDLTTSRLKNFKTMERRRVVLTLGVTYDTPVEKLKKIPPLMRQLIESVENVSFDRAHFASYGDFSLNFEVVYYVLSADYVLYMDVQQQINFLIKEAFETEEIKFAFPTQTLHIYQELKNLKSDLKNSVF